MSKATDRAPTGWRRASRTAIELSRLAGKIVPAYTRGNASIEGVVKVATELATGRSPAPELVQGGLPRFPAAALEPLISAAHGAYRLGALVEGQLRDGDHRLEFSSLGAACVAPARGAQRGGILATITLDAQGSPLEGRGHAPPDPRLAAELSRALNLLRRCIERPAFQLELVMERGGLVVRASAEAAVVVFVEQGISLQQVLALMPDPTSYLDRPTRSPEEAARSSVLLPASPRRGAGALAALGGGVDLVRWLLGRSPEPRRPAPVSPPARSVAPPPIPRGEVEDSATALLRAAEEYVGPRILDRLIEDAPPKAWDWRNRRVALRHPAERIAPSDAIAVYREIHGLFRRGASLSDGLRDFDFTRWLGGVAPRMAEGHLTQAKEGLGLALS